MTRRHTCGRRGLELFTSCRLGAILIALMAAIAVAPTAGAASAAPTKCKIVIKKIHGKKKKVRVCPKPKPKPKPKPPKKITIPTRPNPVTVSPQVDESRSASATIDAAGGTVSASGPNGTSYTLSVPAGALFEDTAITLTPVRSEEHTSELQSRPHLVCRLLLEKKKREHATEWVPSRRPTQPTAS